MSINVKLVEYKVHFCYQGNTDELVENKKIGIDKTTLFILKNYVQFHKYFFNSKCPQQ